MKREPYRFKKSHCFLSSPSFSNKLFIEAHDLKNPHVGSSYTTLEIRLNNVLARLPYFLRDTSSGHLSLSILDSTPLKRSLYNLQPLVYIPQRCTHTYFYVYTTAHPYSHFSDTFFVNPNTTSLELFRPLNAQVQDWYEIFVFVTDTPTLTDKFYQASNNNTALLFFTINILSSIVNKPPQFIDVTEFMCKIFL